MVGRSLNLREINWSSPCIWLFSLSLLVAAGAAKVFATLLLKESRPARWMIGTAMIPRGEVGRIFAAPDRERGISSDEAYAGMVIVTRGMPAGGGCVPRSTTASRRPARRNCLPIPESGCNGEAVRIASQPHFAQTRDGTRRKPGADTPG
jgi:hypothetical protein